MSNLTWYEEEGDKCGTYWYAYSAAHDDGSPFIYRINECKHNANKLYVIMRTDSELITSEDSSRMFGTLFAAQHFCEESECRMVEELI
jgi:hypothetical protein